MEVKIESSWKNALQKEWTKDYFKQLTEFVRREYQTKSGCIFPKPNEIFRAFEACPIDDVRVVILGQDPYPTRGHAHGLCFSVESDVRPLPKSLNNIYKEIQTDLGIEMHENGNLNRWASQGVLLLNTVLTVEEGKAGSHQNRGWEQFTDAVISTLNAERKNVVYLLWGSKAIQKGKAINREDNLVLTAPHPSPLSAYRGFFGCKHFSQSNSYLTLQGFPPIDWS